MKNYRKFKYLLLLPILVVAMCSSSCKKWLDVRPQDGLIKQDYWQTKEQLDAAVMGCYGSLLAGSTIPLSKYLFIWGELRGDMVAARFEPDTEEGEAALGVQLRDELSMIRSDISATNTFANWEAVYKTINYCNTVIKFGPDVLKTDNTLTQQELNAYLAEVRGLRGLMYFYLLRVFKEVPLKLEPTATDKDITALAKSTEAQVYAQVISDLKYAAENALPVYQTIAEDKGRINQYTAYAALADAYLWMDDYANCIASCNKVIQSNKYFIFPAGTIQDDWYRNVYFNGNSVEGIFEFQFDAQKQNPFYNMFNSEFKARDWVVQGGLYGIDLINNTKDIRGNGTSMSEATGSILKYLGKTSTTSDTHWFVYRYADVLLMKAEALAWLQPGNVANGTEAIAIVNQLRLNRGALSVVGDKTVEQPDPSLSDKVAAFVFDERGRELSFEGKRWFDILRNAKRNNYANEKMLLDIVSASAPPSKQQTVINKYKDHRSHYLPIYYYELQTNKALVQNSFYN